jgi:hypothetical protein
MATLKLLNGSSVTVPDEEIDHYRAHGLTAPGQTPAMVLPEGDPDDSWSKAQLDEYANREGFDFTGTKTKVDKLAVIADARPLAESIDI